MSEADAVVFVVDDDPAIRDALTSLLRSVGLAVETFGSAQEFCNRPPPDGPACCVARARVTGPPEALPNQENGKPQTLEESERALILATLKETRWVLAGPKGAAMRLGLNRSTWAFRMKKLGIVRPWQAGGDGW